MTPSQLYSCAGEVGFPLLNVNGVRVGGAPSWYRFCQRARGLTSRQRATIAGQVTKHAAGARLVQRVLAPPTWPTEARVPRSAPVASPPQPVTPGPTERHWRAVRAALEKVVHLGVYTSLGPMVTMPHLHIAWDPSSTSFDYTTTLGRCLYYPTHEIAVLEFRSDLLPERLHRNAIHEFQHAHDAFHSPWMGRDEIEARAEVAVICLGALPW